jgi:hypothetical protein
MIPTISPSPRYFRTLLAILFVTLLTKSLLTACVYAEKWHYQKIHEVIEFFESFLDQKDKELLTARADQYLAGYAFGACGKFDVSSHPGRIFPQIRAIARESRSFNVQQMDRCKGALKKLADTHSNFKVGECQIQLCPGTLSPSEISIECQDIIGDVKKLFESNR